MYAVPTEASVATKEHLWRSILHGAVFILLSATLCLLLIRMLPLIGRLFTTDEAALQYVRAISQGEVSWAWYMPLGYVMICVLLPALHQQWSIWRKTTPVKSRFRLFVVLMWIGYLPMTAFAMAETTIRTIPFKVVISFIAAFARM